MDATRGLRDFSDDLRSLCETLGLTGARKPHLVGWSMGGGVVLQYAIDHAADVASLTMIDPISPFGFGGTKDATGTPCYPDFAGSGGGTANPDYVKRLSEGDRSEESPNSPRNVMNAFYFKPPFRVAPEREDVFVDAMLQMKVSDDNYPGDMQTSENWPGVRPGTTGVNNAISPGSTSAPSARSRRSRRCSGYAVRTIRSSPIARSSTLAHWASSATCPAGPVMRSSRRSRWSRRYATYSTATPPGGGRYTEIVVADCGHSPQIEKPDEFRKAFFAFLAG